MIDHLSPCDVQTTGDCTCTNGLDPERLRAAIRMLYPDDITPTAKRILTRIIDGDEQKESY